MSQYILKRILIAIPTTIGALTFIFFTMRILPGDPAVALMGEAATPEALADMRQMLGLDQPLIVQYGTYLWRAIQGDFGRSIATNYPVTSYIRRMFPYTLLLALSGIGVAILIGVPIGILSSLRRNTPFDFMLRAASLIGLSIPVFYFGILLLIAFSLYLEWFPLIGGGDFSDPLSILHHLVLPATALGLTLAAFVTRLTRSAMLEVISQDYIRTARAKGVDEGRVIFKHALRNTLIPLVTVLGLFVGTLLTGAVLTETVFARPGLGKMLIDGIINRDYPIVQAAITLFTLAVIGVNLIVDVLYGWIDPRISYR
jgi:ABC-type dipeptide/oligopeptide/nickel transport system permease component